MTKCPACGVSLDEIPFQPCETHRRHILAEPEPTEAELEADREYLIAEFSQEQS